jgi:hypothetical protein
VLRPGKFFQLAKAAFDEVTLCVEMFVEGGVSASGKVVGNNGLGGSCSWKVIRQAVVDKGAASDHTR